MKITLVYPPANLIPGHSFNCDLRISERHNVILPNMAPPIGLAYIAASLRQGNFEVNVVDAFVERKSESDIAIEVSKKNPDVVGISCLTMSMPFIKNLIRELKSELDVVTILGGEHPTILPEKVLEDINVDFVVRGEGEETFVNLLQTICEDKDVGLVNGISYRKNGRIINNPPAQGISDLNSLPYPAWDLFDIKKYSEKSREPGTTLLPVVASRGCPNSCIFCGVSGCKKGETRYNYRIRNPIRVAEEIEFMVNKYDANEFFFTDLLFPIGCDTSDILCDELIQRNLHGKIWWYAQSKVGNIPPKSFVKLKHGGCKMIGFGIESGDQSILNNLRKGITIEQSEKTVKDAKMTGLEVVCYFIFGSPGETRDTIEKTINFALKLDPEIAKFIPMIIFPRTELFKRAIKEGLVGENVWDGYIYNGSDVPLYLPQGMTRGDLLKYIASAYSKFYIRPSKIFKYLLKIRSRRDIINYLHYGLSILNKQSIHFYPIT